WEPSALKSWLLWWIPLGRSSSDRTPKLLMILPIPLAGWSNVEKGHTIAMPRIIKFFETTLRDGEQTPSINYFAEEKLEIAHALADMGFDTLDCGFAISGEPEFEAIRLIARNVHNAEICSIARSFPEDIDRAWEAVKDADHPSIHPFISTSPLHREA